MMLGGSHTWAEPDDVRELDDLQELELAGVRFVVDQARAWTDATNGTLRQYLAWIRQQTAEGSRVAEAVLPETDDDAADNGA